MRKLTLFIWALVATFAYGLMRTAIIEGGVVIEGARENVLAVKIGAAALGVAAVLSAQVDTGVQRVVTTGISGLDRPRRITATAGGTAADIKAVSVIVAGLDPLGAALTETLPAFTVNTAGTVTGSKVFARVTSVTIPAGDSPYGDTVSIGAAGLPAVASTTGIHAAVADSGAPQTITTAINQPDVPRNITATVAASTAADVKAISVVITGTNAEDVVITETLPAFTDNTPGTVAGLKAFKTVTSILIPAHDGATALTSIGFGDVVGIGHRLARNTVPAAYLANTIEAVAPTIVVSATDICLNTADLASALNSTQVVVELVQT
jgi:hypothetical protein